MSDRLPKLRQELRTQRIESDIDRAERFQQAIKPAFWRGKQDGLELVQELGSEPKAAARVTNGSLAVGQPVRLIPTSAIARIGSQPRKREEVAVALEPVTTYSGSILFQQVVDGRREFWLGGDREPIKLGDIPTLLNDANLCPSDWVNQTISSPSAGPGTTQAETSASGCSGSGSASGNSSGYEPQISTSIKQASLLVEDFSLVRVWITGSIAYSFVENNAFQLQGLASLLGEITVPQVNLYCMADVTLSLFTSSTSSNPIPYSGTRTFTKADTLLQSTALPGTTLIFRFTSQARFEPPLETSGFDPIIGSFSGSFQYFIEVIPVAQEIGWNAYLSAHKSKRFVGIRYLLQDGNYQNFEYFEITGEEILQSSFTYPEAIAPNEKDWRRSLATYTPSPAPSDDTCFNNYRGNNEINIQGKRMITCDLQQDIDGVPLETRIESEDVQAEIEVSRAVEVEGACQVSGTKTKKVKLKSIAANADIVAIAITEKTR